MIARIVILILLVLLLPQLYIDYRSSRRKTWWWRLMRWLPTLAMMAWTIRLAQERDFVAEDMTEVNIFLLIFGLLFVPKVVYVICSIVGRWIMKARHSRNNWGRLVGFLLAVAIAVIVGYGSFYGVGKLSVRHIEVSIPGLPKSFDGYRIVFFSDAHVGMFTGWRKPLLQRDIDSINAQKPNAIFFGGDLQNLRPSELYPVSYILRQLNAPDGVFSVLGNHDYSDYIDANPAICAANEREMLKRQQQLGWKLLRNSHAFITVGNERIVVAGTENDSPKHDVVRVDIEKTLSGVDSTDCVILLLHDSSSWKQLQVPQRHVQLTLSGHTHGGQFSLFGLRPIHFLKHEDYGLFREGDSQLYVTSGIGGLLPFRFGVWPEIVVITLKS